MTRFTRTLPDTAVVTLTPQPGGATELNITKPIADGHIGLTITLDEASRPWLIRALTVADQAALLDTCYSYRAGVVYDVTPAPEA